MQVVYTNKLALRAFLRSVACLVTVNMMADQAPVLMFEGAVLVTKSMVDRARLAPFLYFLSLTDIFRLKRFNHGSEFIDIAEKLLQVALAELEAQALPAAFHFYGTGDFQHESLFLFEIFDSPGHVINSEADCADPEDALVL